MNAAEEIRKLTQRKDEEAKKEARAFAETLTDEAQPYRGKNGDLMNEEDFQQLKTDFNIPDPTPRKFEATAEDIEAARKWAQSL